MGVTWLELTAAAGVRGKLLELATAAGVRGKLLELAALVAGVRAKNGWAVLVGVRGAAAGARFNKNRS